MQSRVYTEVKVSVGWNSGGMSRAYTEREQNCHERVCSKAVCMRVGAFRHSEGRVQSKPENQSKQPAKQARGKGTCQVCTAAKWCVI